MFSSFRALLYRPFALLWAGQTISSIGDSLYRVALVWWVLEKTGSAVVMGGVLIFTTIPMLIFILLGGVIVDRWPRLPIMFTSDVIRGFVVGLLALLISSNALVVWHIYVISFVFGIVDAVFQPAYRAAIPEVASPETLLSANSLTSLSREVTGIIGPSIAAGIVVLGGSPIAFALDALSFFLSALCLLPILRLAIPPRAETAVGSFLGDMREGLAMVLGTPWLWISIAIAGVSNITYAAPMGVALPFLIKDRLQADVGILGLFYSFNSLGAVLSASWLGRYTAIRRRGVKMYGVWMLVGVMVVTIGLSNSSLGILFAALVIGGANTILGLIWVNTLQERVPSELRGRVSSVDYLGSSLLEPAGYAVGGWATQLLGPSLIFIIGGTLQTLLIALGFLHPTVRKLD